MSKTSSTITNPMTLIAIFATLSETSAAVSLPFLDDQDRECYVWFLISFPFYLLLLFFITLNFNHRSLYSPSDFRKSKHFIKSMNGSTLRRKRILRRTNQVKENPEAYERCRCRLRPTVCILCSRCETGRTKRSRQVPGHAHVTVYIIYHSTDSTAAGQDE